MWFRLVQYVLLYTMVCTITVVKMLWIHEAQLSESTTSGKTTFTLFFTTMSLSWKCSYRKTHFKERASIAYKFLAIWLVYCPKWAFLIGCYNKKQLPHEFWITASSRKVEHSFTKIQLQLFSYCNNDMCYGLNLVLVQNFSNCLNFYFLLSCTVFVTIIWNNGK